MSGIGRMLQERLSLTKKVRGAYSTSSPGSTSLDRRKRRTLWARRSERPTVTAIDDESSTSIAGSLESYDILLRVFGGTMVFQSATDDDLKKDYVLMDKELSLEDLAKFMNTVWKLRVPGIVLSVISNSDYFDSGTDSDIEDFQIGLIQAARLTKMWILTEGINAGVSRIIGEAVAQEHVKRKNLEKDLSRRVGGDMVVIGITATDDLWYGEAIERAKQPVEHLEKFVVENKGDDSHELNSQHTHFLIVSSSEQADKDVKWNTRFLVESKLIQHFHRRHLHKKPSAETNWEMESHSPVVGLLVQGGPKEIERVLWLLRKQIPVIVIKRKGYASGLLAYAFSEGMKGGDSDHLQNIVKPQLMQQVVEAFPEFGPENQVGRMNCRDKILECVKHAVQGECRYLTVLDPSLRGVDQKDLNKFILSAIFNAHKADYQQITRANINKYLSLTLDWNSPEFARRELVPKMEKIPFPVKDELFLQALLLPERQQFVEIFLNMGFQLRRLLSNTRLLYLYEESLNNDFFVHVCLERILHHSTSSLGKKFLDGTNCTLNSVLLTLTGVPRLIHPNQISIGHLAKREEEKQEAERKALLALIYWAVLTNRQALAKVLWKRSSEPIAVALVISNMYYHMSHDWVIDVDLKRKLKSSAVDFGTLAIEMMDLVYNDSSVMAYYALVNPLSDFNELNVVDLAIIGNNIFFIAHPCCQRTMRARWLGRLKIKSSAWDPVHIPEFVKIYLCLFLFFPMYFWLTFNPEKRSNVYIEDDDHEDESDNDDKGQKQEYASKIRRYFKDDLYKSPPVWKKIYYLWTAPISKFWLNQIFIMLYLALFALALMVPYCGSLPLNIILCGWTAIRFIENAMRIIKTKLKYTTFDVFWSVGALLADTYITCVSASLISQQLYNKPLTLWHNEVDYTTYKFLLSLGLLWVYFRSLRFILPISQDLGPMLVNISDLTRRDLINWLQLWLACVISGGLAINAVVYPAQSPSFTNLWRSQMRTFLALFLTEVEDLKGDLSCSPLYDDPEVCCTCNVSTNSYVRHRLENCPYVSLAGYLLVIQQLLITRHIFYTLMFAMFSVTTNRTRERSVEIWKFQFYLMVTECEARSILPVPFTPLTYPFRITFCGAKWLIQCILKLNFCRKLQKNQRRAETRHYDIPYHQWKVYVAAMTKKEEEKETHIQDILAELEEGSDAHNVMIKRLNERVVNIERNQILAGFILESIMNSVEALDPSSSAQRGQIRKVHTASRSSPYPGTYITRFPVLEKDVSWDVKFEAYDPSTYTKPVEEFPRDVQMWIDRDILKLRAQLEEQGLNPMEESGPVSGVLPDPIFNSIQMVRLSNEREVAINRISYITVGDSALQYEIDSTGAPRNPMGRTGLRGRGNLWRWGPNHMIQAVISRWATQATDVSAQQPKQNVSGKGMEILCVKDTAEAQLIYLPGCRVQSGLTPYSSICSYFTNDLELDTPEQEEQEYDQDDMIEYFSKFTTSDMRKKKKAMYTTLGYSAFLVYRGYADDAANTDNAWKETEIWNFHYKYKDAFDTFINDVSCS